MQLVPLKVKIGLNREGQAKYPDFNALPGSVRGNMDWSNYIDTYGSGWLYDSTGHKENDTQRGDEWDSPIGQQWGIILVPETFANAAEETFPNDVEIITEARASNFYDKYHAKDFPTELVDEIALKPFVVKEQMGIALSPQEENLKSKALNPEDATPGIKKNPKKTWNDFVALRGITIKNK